MKVAITGVPGSGKGWLAARLSEAQTGHDVAEVSATLADISSFDMVLLIGLDLAQTRPDVSKVANTPLRNLEAEDQALRDTLARLGKTFHVIYGIGDARLQAALTVIGFQVAMHSIAGNATNSRLSGQLTSEQSEIWQWPCEKCSDPDCEHQLFSRLIS